MFIGLLCAENLGNLVPDSLYSLYHFSHPPLVERLAGKWYILLAAHYLVRYLHDLTFVFLMFMNLAIDTDFGGPADASKTKEKKN
jgi:hypothetical protein